MLRNCAGLGRALGVGALLVTAGCDLNSLFHDGGKVQVTLQRDGGGLGDIVANAVADSPAALADHGDDDGGNRARGTWTFQTATVTLSSVMARTTKGELVDLDIDLPVDVDVVRIDGGRQLQLPDGFLPGDTYDQIVLVMTAVRGLTRDGTAVTIQPPGGGWTAVIPICPLEVDESQTTAVGIALNVRNSFVQAGNWWSFQPRFRSVTSCNTNNGDGN